MSVLQQAQEKMEAAIEHLKVELQTIRTGRANPAMLDNVSVEVYGSQMRLRDVASVSAPEPRQLLITPYDASNASAIGKGIEKANIGATPIVDANVVRIIIPEMDQQVRQEMVKLAHRKREEAKVGVRHVRRDCIDDVRTQKTAGEIPEDIQKKLEKDIQELTDRFCKEADDITAVKEEEISTI